jgi:hypothetical protein
MGNCPETSCLASSQRPPAITSTMMVVAHIAKKTFAIHCRKLAPSSVVEVSMPRSWMAPAMTAPMKLASVGSGKTM